MAEQFALQQCFRQCRATDGDKRLLGPATMVMDRPRDEFLAGTAFPGDQHRHLRTGDLGELSI